MSEERKKEPKVIHVDKLVIKADEVILNPQQGNQPPFSRPSVSQSERPEPIARDFWGFPLPRRPMEAEIKNETESEPKTEEKKEDDKG